jgi:hypothetical protein
MKARLLGFGEIEVMRSRYEADIVIDRGQVRRRRKKPSKRTAIGSATLRCRRRRPSRGAVPA